MALSLRQGDLRALGAAAGLLVALGLAIVSMAPFVAEQTAHDAAAAVGIGFLALGGAATVLLILRVDPVWPFSLGIAAMIFSGNWALAGSPVPLDRVLIGLGLFSLILRARSPRDVFGGKPSGIHFLLICALLYALGSALFAGTLGIQDAKFALLDRFGLLPFILFAVAPAAFPDARSRRILLLTFTAVGAYLAYTSIFGWMGPKSLVFPSYITDPNVGIHADRARGPFVEAAADGLALFECGAAAVILFATEINNRIKLVAAAVAAACALAIILTLTRSVWVASAFALVVTLLVARETRRYFLPGVVGGTLLVLGAFAFIPGLQREADQRTGDKTPIYDRKNSNAAALRMVAERPLLGFGWFTFEKNNSAYMQLGADYPITRSDLAEHNVFLSNAAELGLIGAILWLGALAWAIGGAILRRGPPDLRLWSIGMVAIATQWFVVANFVPLGYAFPSVIPWLWAGVCWRAPVRQTRLPKLEIDSGLRSSPAR